MNDSLKKVALRKLEPVSKVTGDDILGLLFKLEKAGYKYEDSDTLLSDFTEYSKYCSLFSGFVNRRCAPEVTGMAREYSDAFSNISSVNLPIDVILGLFELFFVKTSDKEFYPRHEFSIHIILEYFSAVFAVIDLTDDVIPEDTFISMLAYEAPEDFTEHVVSLALKSKDSQGEDEYEEV